MSDQPNETVPAGATPPEGFGVTPGGPVPDINPDVVSQGGPDAAATTEPAPEAERDENEMVTRWNTLVTRLGYGDLLIPTEE